MLVPLNSQPIISAVVPAPLICTSTSDGPLVRSKEQPDSVIDDAPVCIISKVLRLKPTAFKVLRELLSRFIPVVQNTQLPPLITKVVFDPVTLTPVCAAGPASEIAPEMVQLLHCSVVSFTFSAVPLTIKRQLSNR